MVLPKISSENEFSEAQMYSLKANLLISGVSQHGQDLPKLPYDVALSSELYANVGLHTWPKYSELQIFGKIESLETIHCTAYSRVNYLKGFSNLVRIQ